MANIARNTVVVTGTDEREIDEFFTELEETTDELFGEDTECPSFEDSFKITKQLLSFVVSTHGDAPRDVFEELTKKYPSLTITVFCLVEFSFSEAELIVFHGGKQIFSSEFLEMAGIDDDEYDEVLKDYYCPDED